MFCEIDDYCKDYELSCRKYLTTNNVKLINPKSSMALSEIMTIVVYFHQSRFRDFKSYYKTMILGMLKSYFPKSVSYSRFVELIRY